MNAAVYARKSNAQDVAEDLKSTARQIEAARAFAASKGWTVSRVFEDDAISGGIADRPAVLALKAALIPTALYQIIKRLEIQRDIETVLGIGPTMLAGIGLVGLSMALMLYNPDTVVISTMIWSMWQNGRTADAAVLGVILILLSALLLLGAQAVSHWRRSARS